VDAREVAIAAAALARGRSYGTSWSGHLRKFYGSNEFVAAAWRALAIAYTVVVACFTLLPSDVSRSWLPIDVDQLITPRGVGKSVVVAAFAAGLVLVALAWQRRRIWLSRLSWPLFGYLALCGFGVALLVLISQPPNYLRRVGLDALQDLPEDFDARHMLFYIGFAIVTAIAWRGRVSLLFLGVLLMAYGYALELIQEFVPTRNFKYKDLVSNGLGILLGLSCVHLYDLLLASNRIRLARLRRPRRGRAERSDGGARVQPRRS
jgi:hypothetical protein